jgi:hypothetical protein
MALTNARMKVVIDAELANVTHIGYSTNGTTEHTVAELARTAVSALGGWTTPSAANPYEPGNTSAGESAAYSGASQITITHYAGFSAATSGTQHTEWIPVTDPDPVLVTGGKLTIAANALKPVKGTRS